MSMDEGPLDGGVAEAGPVDGDTGGEADQQPEGGYEAEEPPRNYVEIDDPDNRYVRVKVDGEDVEVPYSEALKGYSREADYTRKAQAVAQQRQEAEFGIRLQQALASNPEMTLRILAEQYGWQPGQQQAPPPPPEDEFADPLERALAEERQAREALEQRISQREADEELQRAVVGLRTQYNLSDEDVQTVVSTAYQMNLGFEALPMIYKTLAFDRLSARVQAARTKQEQERAETTRRTVAKTQAGQVVSNGLGAGNGLTNQVETGGRMTLREAIEAAFDQVERG